VSTGYLIDGVAPGGGGPSLMTPMGAWTENVPTGDGVGVRRIRTYDDGTYMWLQPPLSRALKTDLLNVHTMLRPSEIPNNVPANYFGWIVVSGVFYCYGGTASATDDTYSANVSIDRIFSGPASDLTQLSESTNKLPAVKGRVTAIKNDSYVYLLGGSDGGRIYRAPLADPTSFTDVGAQTFGSSTNTVGAYQAGSTVYVIESNGTTLNNIYSSAYTDLETWVDTGANFPGVFVWDVIFRVGNTFYAVGAGDANTESADVYFASLDDPTNWHAMTGAAPIPELGATAVYVTEDAVYCYGGYVNNVYTNRIWSLTGGSKALTTEPTAANGQCRPLY